MRPANREDKHMHNHEQSSEQVQHRETRVNQHESQQAGRELSNHIHSNPHESQHIFKGMNKEHQGHQPSGVERDKHDHVTHLNFGAHDIYGGKHSSSKHEHQSHSGDGHGHHGTPGHHETHGHGHGHSHGQDRGEHEHGAHGGAHSHDAERRSENSAKHEEPHQADAHGQGLNAMVNIVKNVAREIGLGAEATVGAVAAMLQESGGNPHKIGDHGASVGLFQLNFHGGEGSQAHISKEQAKNPETNARIALQYFKDAQHRSHNPVEIAKMAQRAGDPNYRRNVGAHLHEAQRLIRDDGV